MLGKGHWYQNKYKKQTEKKEETRRRQTRNCLQQNAKWLINNEETTTKTDKQAGFYFFFLLLPFVVKLTLMAFTRGKNEWMGQWNMEILLSDVKIFFFLLFRLLIYALVAWLACWSSFCRKQDFIAHFGMELIAVLWGLWFLCST